MLPHSLSAYDTSSNTTFSGENSLRLHQNHCSNCDGTHPRLVAWQGTTLDEQEKTMSSLKKLKLQQIAGHKHGSFYRSTDMNIHA